MTICDRCGVVNERGDVYTTTPALLDQDNDSLRSGEDVDLCYDCRDECIALIDKLLEQKIVRVRPVPDNDD